MIIPNTGTPKLFPSQKKTDKEKSKKWMMENVDSGVELVNWEMSSGYKNSTSGFRKSKIEMSRLYNIVNGVIDPSDKKHITNPLNLEGFDFPGTAETYPLITPLLSVLTGEERNRFHYFDVTVTNHDAISEKQSDLRGQLDKLIMQDVQDNSSSKEEVEAKLKKFGKWGKFSYRDIRERMGYQVLSYLRKNLSLDFEFSRGFEDFLIVGEQIYISDIVAGEPIVRKGNPLNFTFVRSNDSIYPEDSDIIIEDGYLSPHKVIDEYYDVLSNEQIKKLENGSSLNQKLNNSMFDFQNKQIDFDLDFLVEQNSDGVGSEIYSPSGSAMFGLSGAYDRFGRIRRTRVLWKSMRKIGIISYVDENGDIQKTIVPEQYEANLELNEDIKWLWINEWWEGTKIGEDIYVKMQPRPVQFREMTNISKCKPGIIGIINNVNSSKVTSFVSSLKPIQYLYDEFVYRMQTSFMTSYGNIARLDVSQIPDGWTMDKWLYYATVFKWAINDPMKEGEEGVARGKLAGTMNQPSNTFNLDQGNMIQQNMLMLQYLESRADEIAGITPQRKGSMSSRETLGGIERSVSQSSHRTEKWYSLHDHVKLMVYKSVIETAKVAWRDDKFKRTFFMDDMTEAMLDFDSQVFNEAEYGIMVNDSKADTKVRNLLEGSRDTLLQNGFQISTVIDILRNDNLSSMQRKIEQTEEEMNQAKQQAEQSQIKQLDEADQRRENIELEKIAMNERNNIRDNQTKILLKQDDIVDNNDDNNEDNKIRSELIKHKDKLELEEKKLNENIRHNKEAEKISKMNKKTI